MKPKKSIHRLLLDLRKHVAFHDSLGIAHYPESEELRRFFDQALPALPASPLPVDRDSGGRQTSSPAASGPPAQARTLASIRNELGDCTRCALHATRSRILFGSGNPRADLVIVGEWPNSADDGEGLLFSGQEGELLTKMLAAIKIDLNDVYLASIVKCKASEVSPPQAEQVRACVPFLWSQLEVIAPKVICAMGPLAAQTILKTNKPLIRLRGKFHTFNAIPVMPTFHPSYLLKNPEMKQAVWIDLQLIQQKLRS